MIQSANGTGVPRDAVAGRRDGIVRAIDVASNPSTRANALVYGSKVLNQWTGQASVATKYVTARLAFLERHGRRFFRFTFSRPSGLNRSVTTRLGENIQTLALERKGKLRGVLIINIMWDTEGKRTDRKES